MDYKKYSLEKLETWMEDALNSSEASPQEIYDVIKRVVEENYYYFKHHTGRAYELLALLNGNGRGHIKAYDDYVKSKDTPLSCDKDDPSPECQGAWNDFWEEVDEDVRQSLEEKGYEWTPIQQKDKVVKWQLPVQQVIEEGIDNYFVQFPDDLLEAANLKEGDIVDWVDQGDGSYLLKKVEKKLTYDEMIAAGYIMTDDGFWIKEK